VKIIVYDDNPDFGGHQIMACHGIEALASDPSNEIFSIHNPGNHLLFAKLAAIAPCTILEAPCSTRIIHSRIHACGIRELQHMFETLEADLVLCIQGDIRQSSRALLAARKAGVECISYIALAHHSASMGAKLGWLKDMTNQSLFHEPTRFITISDGMAGLLRSRGVKQRIDIVTNGISMPSAPSPVRQVRPAVLGMLGRIEFKQKQQDFMVRAFCGFPQVFDNCRLVIAGDGPDRIRLEQQVAGGPCKATIDLRPWQTDIDAFFASIDMLVIPSRFEGVPLVMLEALARGIPVIGSNRDGMKEILPDSWTFDAESPAALAETFSRVRDTWQNDIDPVRQGIFANHSLEAFRKNFAEAVAGRF